MNAQSVFALLFQKVKIANKVAHKNVAQVGFHHPLPAETEARMFALGLLLVVGVMVDAQREPLALGAVMYVTALWLKCQGPK